MRETRRPYAWTYVTAGTRVTSAELRAGVIGGKDILAEAVTRAYAKAGMRLRYLDDWRTHHVFGGEVHCGTNTMRAAGTPWCNSPNTELTAHRRLK